MNSIIIPVFNAEKTIEILVNNISKTLAKNYDFTEICITSGAEISINNSTTEEIIVEASKAEGEKCSRCWKILENPCERKNCGLKN